MITTAAIATEVRRLADEQPERTARCHYLNRMNGEPVCIVGHALVNLGYDTDLLFQYNGGWIDSMIRKGTFPGIKDTGEAAWLRAVQDGQDEHAPWGVAVDIADREYKA